MTEFLKFASYGVATLFLVYVVIRLATAAYFKSKQQYEQQQKG